MSDIPINTTPAPPPWTGAEDMVLDFDGWMQKQPAPIQKQWGASISAAPDPEKEKKVRANVAWIAEHSGLHPADVARDYRTARAGFAAISGFSKEAGEDDAVFNSFVTDRAARQRDQRVMLKGTGKDDEEGRKLFEKSMSFAAMQSGAGETTTTGAPAYMDGVDDYLKWTSHNQGDGAYDAANSHLYLAEWVRIHRSVAAEWAIARKAAEQVLPILQGLEHEGGVTAYDAVPFIRGLTDNQLAMMQRQVRIMADKKGGQGKHAAKGDVAEVGEAFGRMLFNIGSTIWEGAETGAYDRVNFAEGKMVKKDRLAAGMESFVETEAREDPLARGGQPHEYVKMTKAQAEEANAILARKREDAGNLRKLREIAQGDVMPISKDSMLKAAAVGVAESLPVMGIAMVPYAGPVVLANYYTADAKAKLTENGVPEGHAKWMAPAIGVAQALGDMMEVSLLKKTPGLAGLFGSYGAKGVAPNAIGRFAERLAATTWAEIGVEHFQDFTPKMVQDFGALLFKDVQGTKDQDIAKEIWTSTVDMMPSMFAMSLVGTGSATVDDIKAFGKIVQTGHKAMQQLGIEPAGIESIMSKATPREAAAELRKWWKTRTPVVPGDTQRASSAEALGSLREEADLERAEMDPETVLHGTKADAFYAEQRRQRKAAEATPSTPAEPGAPATAEPGEPATDGESSDKTLAFIGPLRRDDKGWNIVGEDGSTTPVGTVEAGHYVRESLKMGDTKKSAEAYVSIIDRLFKPGMEFTLTGESVTATEGGATKTITAAGETILDRVKVAEEIATINEELAIAGVKEGVVDGSNWVEEGITKIALNRSPKGAMTAIHEVVEAGVKAGNITQAELQEVAAVIAPLFQVERPATKTPLSAEAIASEQDLGQRLADISTGKASPTVALETIVELMVANEIGKRKDGGNFEPGTLTTALQDALRRSTTPAQVKALGKIAAWMRAIKSYMRALFSTVAKLDKARREGADLEALDRIANKAFGRAEPSAEAIAAGEKTHSISKKVAEAKAEKHKKGTEELLKSGASKVSDVHDEERVGTALLGTDAKPLPTPQTSNVAGKVVPDELLARQMEAVNYRHLPADILNEKDPHKKRDMLVQWFKENLLALHDRYAKGVRERATHWYDGARLIAEEFAMRYGITPRQSAGVLAVLSPQKDWFMNVAQAEQVIDIWHNHQKTVLTESLVREQMEEIINAAQALPSKKRKKKPLETKVGTARRRAFNKRLDDEAKAKRRAILEPLMGKSISQIQDETDRGWAIRLLAQSIHGRHYSVISPEGEAMQTALNDDGTPQKNGWGAILEIAKAVRILKDGSLATISDNLGTEHKVRNFYNNIIAPNSPFGDATIDTHAVAAAHLMPFGASATEVNHNFGSGMPGSGVIGVSGLYHVYMDAYTQAAKDRDIQPRQMQSITWEAIRQVFPPESRRSKEVIASAYEAWKGDDSDASRTHILRKGIPNPPWVGAGPSGKPHGVAGGIPAKGSGDVPGGSLRFRGGGSAGADARGDSGKSGKKSFSISPGPVVSEGFYSQVEKTVLDKMPVRASSDQVIGMLGEFIVTSTTEDAAGKKTTKVVGRFRADEEEKAEALADSVGGGRSDWQSANRIKQEELKWNGLIPWLKSQAQPVAKDAVVNYLRDDGAVRFEEVVFGEGFSNRNTKGMIHVGEESVPFRIVNGAAELMDGMYDNPDREEEIIAALNEGNMEGEDWTTTFDQTGDTHYSQYQLPGGKNYREVVMTKDAPTVSVPAGGSVTDVRHSGGKWYHVTAGGEWGTVGYESEEEAEAARPAPVMVERRDDSQVFKAPHFTDIENPVAHTRINERNDSTGAPGVFMEEVQSDRHQKGREKGYAGEVVTYEAYFKTANHGDVVLGRGTTPEEAMADIPAGWAKDPTVVSGAVKLETRAVTSTKEGIPDAPYRTTWPIQMFKRALRDAVEAGKAWVGWTTGQTQIDRYEEATRQNVDQIHYEPFDEGGRRLYELAAYKNGREVFSKDNVTEEEMKELVGKELSAKMANNEGRRLEDAPARDWRIFEGTDLAIGGEGMKMFYDRMLPTEVGKYVKQWGGKVEGGAIPMAANTVTRSFTFRDGTQVATAEEAEALVSEKGEWELRPTQRSTPIWKVTITPAMREGVAAGQASFSISPRSEEFEENMAEELVNRLRGPGELTDAYVQTHDDLMGMTRAVRHNASVADAMRVAALEAKQTREAKTLAAAHDEEEDKLSIRQENEMGAAREDGWTADQKDALMARHSRERAQMMGRQRVETAEMRGKHNTQRARALAADKRESDRTTMLRGLAALETMTRRAPAEVRVKVGGFLRLASLTDNEAIQDELLRRIDRMDKVWEAFLRNKLQDDIEETVKKARPAREPGEKPKGKLGAPGHALVDAVAAAIEMTKDEAEKRIDELTKVLETSTDLDEQAEASEALNIVSRFGALRTADMGAETLADNLKWLERNIKQHRSIWRMREEARIAEQKDLINAGTADIGAADMADKMSASTKPTDAMSALRVAASSIPGAIRAIFGKDSIVTKRWRRKLRTAVNGTLDDAADMEQEFGGMVRLNFGAGMPGWRKFFDMFQHKTMPLEIFPGGRERKATIPAVTARDIIDGKAPDLAKDYDKVSLENMRDALEENDKRGTTPGDRRSPLSDIEFQRTGAAAKKVMITRAEAIHYLMMWAQEQGRRPMEAHGFTPEGMKDLADKLPAEARALMDWMARHYREEWGPLNEVFSRMRGIGLPNIPNYAPLMFAAEGKIDSGSMDPFAGASMEPGGMSMGMLKSRREKHMAEPDIASAFSTFFRHMKRTSYFRHFAEIAREMRNVLGSKDIQNAIKTRFGPNGVKMVNDLLAIIDRGGSIAPVTIEDARLNKIAGARALASLSLNPGSLMKQSSAIVNLAYKMPAGQFLRRLPKAFAGLLDVGAMKRSITIQRRSAAGSNPDMQQALAYLDALRPTRLRTLAHGGLMPMQVADAYFTAVSSAIYFDWKKSDLKKQNPSMTDADIETEARQQLEEELGDVAQPISFLDKSIAELNRGALARLAFMFQSESRQKVALQIEAGGEKDWGMLTKAIVMNGLMGMMMQGIATIWSFMRDDDDDKLFDADTWDWKDFAIAATLGQWGAVPVLGGIFVEGLAQSLKGVNFDNSLASDMKKAGQAVKDIYKTATVEDKRGELKAKEPVEKIVSAAVGLTNAAAVLMGKGEYGTAARVGGYLFDFFDKAQDDAEEIANKAKAERAKVKKDLKEAAAEAREAAK